MANDVRFGFSGLEFRNGLLCFKEDLSEDVTCELCCGCVRTNLPYCAICDDNSTPSGVLDVDGGAQTVCGVEVEIRNDNGVYNIYEDGEIYLANYPCEEVGCTVRCLLCQDFHTGCCEDSPGTIKFGTLCDCDCCCKLVGPSVGDTIEVGPDTWWTITDVIFDCGTGNWTVGAVAGQDFAPYRCGVTSFCGANATQDATTCTGTVQVPEGTTVTLGGSVDLDTIPCNCVCDMPMTGTSWGFGLQTAGTNSLAFSFRTLDCRTPTTQEVHCIF